MRTGAASASAPASVGNVAVGFDSLGLSLPVAFDTVTAVATPDRAVRLGAVTGLLSALPGDVMRNTALRAAKAVLETADAPFGVRLDVDKGVPVSAGMGGSAASAVAAAMAVNALLDAPLSREALLPLAIEGEAASCESPPRDNVAASLYGGLTLVAPSGPARATPVPLPRGLGCVLVHPHREAETRAGRAALPDAVPFRTAVEHGAQFAAFISACHRSDLEAIAEVMTDLLAEPVRAPAFPWFAEVQAGARAAGALACSLSGSGPSIFAWARMGDVAAVRAAMAEPLVRASVGYDVYDAPLSDEGARIVAAEAA